MWQGNLQRAWLEKRGHLFISGLLLSFHLFWGTCAVLALGLSQTPAISGWPSVLRAGIFCCSPSKFNFHYFNNDPTSPGKTVALILFIPDQSDLFCSLIQCYKKIHSLLSLDLLPPIAVPFSHCHDPAWVADTGLCEGVFNFLLPLQQENWKPQSTKALFPLREGYSVNWWKI